MPEAVIVDAVRSPSAAPSRARWPSCAPTRWPPTSSTSCSSATPTSTPRAVEEVCCGCGMPQGLQAFNIARIIVLLSEKLPQTVNGVTISRYCASSLDAIRHAANAIKAGEGDTYIAAGVEWVSRFNERTEPAGAADQNAKLQGNDGQPNAYIEMGITAVNVAKHYEVSRADMDKYAQRSQELAVRLAGVRLLRPRDRPGHAPGRHRGRQGRRAPRQLDAREALRAARGVRGRRRRHRRQLVPAQRRRRRGAGDVGHEGARSSA